MEMARKIEWYVPRVLIPLIYVSTIALFWIVPNSHLYLLKLSNPWFFLEGIFLFVCVGIVMAVVHGIASGPGLHEENCSTPGYGVYSDCGYWETAMVPFGFWFGWLILVYLLYGA